MGEIKIKSGNLYTIEMGDDRWGTLSNSQIISRTDGVLQIEMTSERNSGVYALSASAIKQLSNIRSTVSYSFDIRADTNISVLAGYEVQGARVNLQVSDEWVTVKIENILFTQSYSFTIVNRSSGGTVYVRNFMLNEGSTALPYQPYFLNRPAHQFTNGQFVDIPTHHFTNNRWQGELTSQSPLKFRADGEMLDWRIKGASGGVGDYDETEQKYRIPITVEGNNLFDGEWKQGTIATPSSSIRLSNKNVISLKPNTVYTIGLRGSSIIQYALVYRDKDGNVTYDSGWFSMASPVLSPTSDGVTAEILLRRSDAGSITPIDEEVLSLKVIFTEGKYTASTIPLYEVNIFTDHQLMDGDSIDYTTDQTQIPIATGNNTLSVDTAVKPKSVFVKFEG